MYTLVKTDGREIKVNEQSLSAALSLGWKLKDSTEEAPEFVKKQKKRAK